MQNKSVGVVDLSYSQAAAAIPSDARAQLADAVRWLRWPARIAVARPVECGPVQHGTGMVERAPGCWMIALPQP